MEKIKYNKDNLLTVIGEGIESIVYLYRDNKGNKVALKKFKDEYKLDNRIIKIKEKTLLNKEKKLELLSKKECMKDEIELRDLVYENDRFIGFTSTYEDNKPLYYYLDKNRKKKLKILNELKEKVIKLNENGIFIGDFNHDNFSIVNKKIKLFDIDNYKVDEYNFDIATALINYYYKKCQREEYIDNYCFNIYSISFLEDIPMSNVLNYLQNYKLDSKKNEELKIKILSPDNSYNGELFIDNIKKGLFK